MKVIRTDHILKIYIERGGRTFIREYNSEVGLIDWTSLIGHTEISIEKSLSLELEREFQKLEKEEQKNEALDS